MMHIWIEHVGKYVSQKLQCQREVMKVCGTHSDDARATFSSILEEGAEKFIAMTFEVNSQPC